MLTAQQVGKQSKGSKQLASEMCLVHNVLLRGLNAIYNQARNVAARGTAKDKSDFANFAYGWAAMLEEHHEAEETLVFPGINELTGVPGLMDGNVDEHKAFHDGLSAYTAYLDKVRSGKEELDGDKLVSIIDSFAAVLRDHLENEIDTLLGLEKYEDKCDWGAWFKETIDKVVVPAMKKSEYRVSLRRLLLFKGQLQWNMNQTDSCETCRPTSSPWPSSSTTRRSTAGCGRNSRRSLGCLPYCYDGCS